MPYEEVCAANPLNILVVSFPTFSGGGVTRHWRTVYPPALPPVMAIRLGSIEMPEGRVSASEPSERAEAREKASWTSTTPQFPSRRSL